MVNSKTLLLFLTAITTAAASDFSTWSSPDTDCSGDASDTYPDVLTTTCAKLGENEGDITSVKVTKLSAGCSVTFYTDDSCTASDNETPDLNVCTQSPGSLLWVAFSISC